MDPHDPFAAGHANTGNEPTPPPRPVPAKGHRRRREPRKRPTREDLQAAIDKLRTRPDQ